jgi:hypothetical protein
VADVVVVESGGVLSFVAGVVEAAWLSFAASMMTVLVEVEKWESLTKGLCLSRRNYRRMFFEAEDRRNGTEGRLHGGCFTGRNRI